MHRIKTHKNTSLRIIFIALIALMNTSLFQKRIMEFNKMKIRLYTFIINLFPSKNVIEGWSKSE